LVAGLGSPQGSLVGGVLIGIFDRHAIFLVTLPLMTLSLILSIIFIPKVDQEKQNISLDYLGSILLAISIASLVLLSKFGCNRLNNWICGLLRRSTSIVFAKGKEGKASYY